MEDESWESNDGFVITEALWRRNRREAILESSRGLKQEESWRRQILQEEASKRNVGRRILERESSKSSPGAVRKRTWSKSVRKGIMFWSTGAPRGCQEAHTRHPGGTQAAPRRHPGGTQEACWKHARGTQRCPRSTQEAPGTPRAPKGSSR